MLFDIIVGFFLWMSIVLLILKHRALEKKVDKLLKLKTGINASCTEEGYKNG